MRADMDHKINKHAQKQMEILGITVYKSIPQTLFDGWEFLIDSNVELPEYIRWKK
jgi:hypothetical protein